MKKFATLLLGLALVVSYVTPTFADDNPSAAKKKKKKKKGLPT